MAATRSKSRRGETLELVLVFGQKKLPLLVSSDGSDRAGECLTIGHLSDAVTEVTQVKADRQKLIHRGRTLFKHDAESMKATFETTLSSLGIKSGERIMLLCKKVSEKQEENESSVGNEKNVNVPPPDRLGQLRSQFETINGRLEQEVTASSSNSQDLPGLKSSRRVLMALHEETMRLLETVDSTMAQADSAPDFRTQRKALVNALQYQLDQCEGQLSDVTKQIKSLEQRNQPGES